MNRKPIVVWKDGGPKWVAGYIWKINGIPVAAYRENDEHEYNFVDLRTGDVFGNTKCYTLAAAEMELRKNVPGPWFPNKIMISKKIVEQISVIQSFERGT